MPRLGRRSSTTSVAISERWKGVVVLADIPGQGWRYCDRDWRRGRNRPGCRRTARRVGGTSATNLVGVLEVSRRTIPYLRAAGWGRIVTVGSLAGKHGLPNMSVYSATSAGVIAFTKALAQELADTGILVNCVTPGPIDTELITRLAPRVVESMIASSPLKRLGTAAEVAELVVWLCSPAASFRTGAVFDLSGGDERPTRARQTAALTGVPISPRWAQPSRDA